MEGAQARRCQHKDKRKLLIVVVCLLSIFQSISPLFPLLTSFLELFSSTCLFDSHFFSEERQWILVGVGSFFQIEKVD